MIGKIRAERLLLCNSLSDNLQRRSEVTFGGDSMRKGLDTNLLYIPHTYIHTYMHICSSTTE
jgi:hypothetical protein